MDSRFRGNDGNGRLRLIGSQDTQDTEKNLPDKYYNYYLFAAILVRNITLEEYIKCTSDRRSRESGNLPYYPCVSGNPFSLIVFLCVSVVKNYFLSKSGAVVKITFLTE